MGEFEDIADGYDDDILNDGIDMRRKKQVDPFDSDQEVDDLGLSSDALIDPFNGNKKGGKFFGF